MTTSDKNNNEKTQIPREVDLFFKGHANHSQFTIKLYEQEKKRNGKVKKEWLCNYDNELPDEEDIREDWGGGDYVLFSDVIDNDGKPLMKEVPISKVWGKGKVRLMLESERKKQEQIEMAGSLPTPQNPPRNLWDDIEKISNIASPIVDKIVNAIKEKPKNDTFESLQKTLMKGHIDSLSQMRNALTTNTINQLMPKTPKKNNDEFGGAMVKEIVMDAYEGIKKHLPKYLNASGVKRDVYEEMMKENDTFQQVTGDLESVNQLYDMLCKDPEIGKGKANEFIQKLGLEVDDDDLEQQPQTTGEN